MDPFVEIEYKGKQYKTKVNEDGGKNPQWNESFDIPIVSMSDTLKITCFDEDALSNDVVATKEFSLEMLCENQGINEWLSLEYEGKKAADVQVETIYVPPRDSWT